jgi:hypothetical protein
MNRREQRALREYELVRDVATRPVPFISGEAATMMWGPSGPAIIEQGKAEWRSHVHHVLVYALDVYCEACGLPLRSTRQVAKIAGVTHTTIARIRAQIRKNPGAYEAIRRLYLRHARSGRPGRPKAAFATLRAASK